MVSLQRVVKDPGNQKSRENKKKAHACGADHAHAVKPVQKYAPMRTAAEVLDENRSYRECTQPVKCRIGNLGIHPRRLCARNCGRPQSRRLGCMWQGIPIEIYLLRWFHTIIKL